jgi:hypothetical protein
LRRESLKKPPDDASSRHPQTLRDLEHGTLHIRTPQTRIRRATGFHVLQRCPVASKAATPCWRKTSFSRRTPTTLRSGTVDHRARGCHVSGRRAMNAGQNPSPTGPSPCPPPALRQGRGEDPSRSVFFFTMMIENRQAFRARLEQAAKLVSWSRMMSSAATLRRAVWQRLVELDGIEPTTSCLQSTRSPS